MSTHYPNDIWEQELFSAIDRGYMTIVQRMLAQRFPKNGPPREYAVPLNLAIELNRVDIASALIDHDADVNDAREGDTPLHYAVWESEAITRLLLSHGADPNKPGEHWTPLGIVARRMTFGHDIDGIACALLEAGANPNTCYHDEPILAIANRHGYTAVAQSLIDHGADVPKDDISSKADRPTESSDAAEIISRFNISPERLLRFAIWTGNIALVRSVIDHGVNLETRNEDGETPLMIAVEEVAPPIVRILLDAGADPAALDRNKRSVLYHAVSDLHIASVYNTGNEADCLAILQMLLETGVLDQEPGGDIREHVVDLAVLQGSTDAVRLLLEHGADPDRDYHGEPLSMWAVRGGHYDVFLAMEKAGTSLRWDTTVGTNGAQRMDRTVFVSAAASGSAELVAHFLKAGADSLTQPMLNCALSAAAKCGSIESVMILLSAGAVVNAPEGSGYHSQAIGNAVESGNTAMLRVLLEAGGPHEEALYEAAQHSDIELVHWLLDRGVNINAVRRGGETALMGALWPRNDCADEELVDLLIGRGADVNSVDDGGSTALCWAAGNLAVMRKLLAAGADPNIGHDITPLMRAAKCGEEECVDLLLNAGADVNAVTKDGDTAWRMAHAQGAESIARKLEALGAREPAIATQELHAAILWGKTEDAIRLIRAGSDLEKLANSWCSPMISAINLKCDISVIEALLEYGAGVDTSCGVGNLEEFAPLICAIHTGRPDVIRLLLRHGANANGKEACKPPLSHACSRVEDALPETREMWLGIVRMLLDAGASPNVDDGGPGQTPLQQASEAGDIVLMEMLLEYGADLEWPSGSEYMPAYTALAAATAGLREDAVRRLLDHGAIVDAVDSAGSTPLIYVCNAKLARIDDEMDRLPGMVPRPDDPDKEPRILRIAKLLIAHGANTNHRNRYGRNPLHDACSVDTFTEQRLALIRLLRDSGADVNAEDEWGWTPISLASRAGAQNAVAILTRADGGV